MSPLPCSHMSYTWYQYFNTKWQAFHRHWKSTPALSDQLQGCSKTFSVRRNMRTKQPREADVKVWWDGSISDGIAGAGGQLRDIMGSWIKGVKPQFSFKKEQNSLNDAIIIRNKLNLMIYDE
ncbi:hypothetical protein Peur_009951 [Populus x canadensis]